jgi:hypothetical protein
VKTLVTNYTFSASAKQITFTGYPSLKLDQILLITNVTNNTIIYNFADPTAGGTVAGNVLTLTYNTTTMSNSDRLQIFIDDYIVPATENSLTGVQVKIDSTNTLLTATNFQLESLNNKQTVVNLDVSAINVNTDQVETLLANTNTLLNELTSFTFYGVTSSTPMYINQGNLDASVDSVTVSGVDLDSVVTELSAVLENQTKTHSSTTTLTSRFIVEGSKRVYSIFGFSDSSADQYIQLRSASLTSSLVTVFYIPAKSNFSFDFFNGLYFNTRFLLTNSLTPIEYTPGNNDLFVTAIHTV